jgi:antitoxin component of MazEF toxin-antitoxin module
MTTVILEEDPETGELIMPIPDDMWKALGWEIGDTLVWEVRPDNTIHLTKKESTTK